MFGRKGLQAYDRSPSPLFMQAEALLPGDRVVGESIGGRIDRELDMAIDGRMRDGIDWRAPEGTMLPASFLEGDIGEIRLAREGRFDLMGRDQDRAMLESHSAMRSLPYDTKPLSKNMAELSKGPVSGPMLEIMSLAIGSGRSR